MSRPLYITKRRPGTHRVEGLFGPRIGLDILEYRKLLTLSGIELRFLGRPASNQVTARYKNYAVADSVLYETKYIQTVVKIARYKSLHCRDA